MLGGVMRVNNSLIEAIKKELQRVSWNGISVKRQYINLFALGMKGCMESIEIEGNSIVVYITANTGKRMRVVNLSLEECAGYTCDVHTLYIY